MKKLLILICLVMALVSPSALAAESAPEPSLWPAYDPETGLWGYIDAQGAWGIVPQYKRAYHFHGGCAIVNMGDAPLWQTECTQGIIDETGAFLLPPEYIVFDFCDEGMEDIYFIMDNEAPDAEKMGWFNIPNRFFSGMHWYETYSCEGSPYVEIRVSNRDAQMGLADRATGEIVLPPAYTVSGLYVRDVEDGFLVAEHADNGVCELIEIGKGPVPLPEGVTVDYGEGISEGLLPFEKDGLYGYLNTAGEIVIEAQFCYARAFQDGYASVTLPGDMDLIRLIDHQGQTVMMLTGFEDPWSGGYQGVVDGALFISRPNESWSLIEPDGRVRCHYEMPEHAGDVWLYEVSPDAPILVRYDLADDEYIIGLMSHEGEMLVPPCWEWVDAVDAQGWRAACLDGRWGYVDLYGSTMLPFVYEEAASFEGDLARVMLDASTEGYVNRAGEVIYQWPALPED